MEKYTTPRNRIHVNEAACGNAVSCLKCVTACLEHGPNLLGYLNKEIPPVGENAPKSLQEIDHKIITRWMILCDGWRNASRPVPRVPYPLRDLNQGNRPLVFPGGISSSVIP